MSLGARAMSLNSLPRSGGPSDPADRLPGAPEPLAGPAEKAALRSVLSGRQWTQARCYAARFTEHDRCVACFASRCKAAGLEWPLKEENETIAAILAETPVGSLIHRTWSWPSTASQDADPRVNPVGFNLQFQPVQRFGGRRGRSAHARQLGRAATASAAAASATRGALPPDRRIRVRRPRTLACTVMAAATAAAAAASRSAAAPWASTRGGPHGS